MNLALKYRPREFDDVVGQKANSVILKAMIDKNKLSQVLLFTGPSGIGKTSMARIIAAQVNSEGAEDVHQGTHPAVLEIDAASNGSVEAIRQLKRDVNYAIIGHRVVILDEAHAMSPEAFAALLNLLEFPPTNVTFILITTEAHKIPKTIRHRCDHYKFKKASVEDLIGRLRWVVSQEGIEIEDALVDLIAQRSEGSYREALMILDQVNTGGISSVAEYNNLQGEVDYGPSLILSATGGSAAALIKLDEVLRYTAAEDVIDRTVDTLKDIMVLKGGMQLSHSGQALESRLELASKLGIDQVLKAIRIVWDLQTKLGAGDPVRGLEMAYSLLGEILNLGINTPSVTTPKPTSATAMSIEDMRKYR